MMSTNATLMAIGPFTNELVEYLDYGPWDYKGVKEGDRVVMTLVTCRTADASRALAEALGFKLMDLGKHVFDGVTQEQHKRLIKFMVAGEGVTAAECSMESFDKIARNRRWTFVYQPNA